MLLPDSEILHDRSYRKIGEYCVNLKDVILKFCDMKFRLALLMMILFPALACVAKPSRLSELTVMSYNIRVGDADDGTNSWRFRFPATALMIEDQKPDVFGVQEAMSYQLLFMIAHVVLLLKAASQPSDGLSGVSESQKVPHFRRETVFLL